jgi:signal peptidase I
MSGSKSEKKSRTPKAQRHWIIDNIISLGLALLIVLMIRSSLVEAFKIPSGSMIPTLFIGDHIFVNKLAYGLKIPFSDIFLDHPVFLIKRDPPKAGDVVVFIYPKDESLYYIKRVVGVPGDQIEIRNKVLYINHKMITRDPLSVSKAEKILKEVNDPKYTVSNIEIYNEHLKGIDHISMFDRNSYMGDPFGPITVPNDSIFVMGDNRDYSNDSRYWGYVPIKNVKGKALVIWLSLWASFSENQFLFRPNRIGTVIH